LLIKMGVTWAISFKKRPAKMKIARCAGLNFGTMSVISWLD
jgi:hypothetical protein